MSLRRLALIYVLPLNVVNAASLGPALLSDEKSAKEVRTSEYAGSAASSYAASRSGYKLAPAHNRRGRLTEAPLAHRQTGRKRDDGAIEKTLQRVARYFIGGKHGERETKVTAKSLSKHIARGTIDIEALKADRSIPDATKMAIEAGVEAARGERAFHADIARAKKTDVREKQNKTAALAEAKDLERERLDAEVQDSSGIAHPVVAESNQETDDVEMSKASNDDALVERPKSISTLQKMVGRSRAEVNEASKTLLGKKGVDQVVRYKGGPKSRKQIKEDPIPSDYWIEGTTSQDQLYSTLRYVHRFWLPWWWVRPTDYPAHYHRRSGILGHGRCINLIEHSVAYSEYEAQKRCSELSCRAYFWNWRDQAHYCASDESKWMRGGRGVIGWPKSLVTPLQHWEDHRDVMRFTKADKHEQWLGHRDLIYLAPPGAHRCLHGETLGKWNCYNEARRYMSRKKIKKEMGRRHLIQGWGGVCGDNGWGSVPPGCSIQTGLDWAAHFRHAGHTREGCIRPEFQLLCKKKEANWHRPKCDCIPCGTRTHFNYIGATTCAPASNFCSRKRGRHQDGCYTNARAPCECARRHELTRRPIPGFTIDEPQMLVSDKVTEPCLCFSCGSTTPMRHGDYRTTTCGRATKSCHATKGKPNNGCYTDVNTTCDCLTRQALLRRKCGPCEACDAIPHKFLHGKPGPLEVLRWLDGCTPADFMSIGENINHMRHFGNRMRWLLGDASFVHWNLDRWSYVDVANAMEKLRTTLRWKTKTTFSTCWVQVPDCIQCPRNLPGSREIAQMSRKMALTLFESCPVTDLREKQSVDNDLGPVTQYWDRIIARFQASKVDIADEHRHWQGSWNQSNATEAYVNVQAALRESLGVTAMTPICRGSIPDAAPDVMRDRMGWCSVRSKLPGSWMEHDQSKMYRGDQMLP